jgi:hypothetical protein
MAKKNPTDPEANVEQEEVEQEVEQPAEGLTEEQLEQEVEAMAQASAFLKGFRMMQDAQLEAMRNPQLLTAADYEPVALPLRSGAEVHVRPTDLQSLVFSGLIPEPLLSAAIKAAEGHYDVRLSDDETIGMSLQEIKEEEVKATRRMVETLNIMASAVVVKPRIVATLDELKEAQEQRKEGEDAPLWAGWLSREDKIDILQYAQAPVVALRAFRTK